MVLALGQPRRAAVRRCRLGPPVLTASRARSVRRFVFVNAVLVLLAGWLTSRSSGVYDQAYGWMALGLYLGTAVLVQLLSVLPTVRRLAGELE